MDKFHFRFSRTTVDEILADIHVEPLPTNVRRHPVQPAEGFLMSLCVMANYKRIRTVADKFKFRRLILIHLFQMLLTA